MIRCANANTVPNAKKSKGKKVRKMHTDFQQLLRVAWPGVACCGLVWPTLPFEGDGVFSGCFCLVMPNVSGVADCVVCLGQERCKYFFFSSVLS